MTLLVCVFAFIGSSAGAFPLTPAVTHGDFAYYTLALTWQPGICATDEGCRPDQPKGEPIGLHGLWASLPRTLVAAGVTPEQWRQRGCDLVRHSDAEPVLDPALKRRLGDVTPHFADDLLAHEYDKHVQCFGFDPNQFFENELALRERVVNSAFGDYVVSQQGRDVAHSDMVAAFRSAYSTSNGTALQLRCGADATGQWVLTQIWISVPADRLDLFPLPSALVDAPIDQDTCPLIFHVSAWPGPPALPKSRKHGRRTVS